MTQQTDPPPLPQRKRPGRLPLYEYGNLSPIIYLTICAKDRKAILAKDDVHHLLTGVWSDPENHWSVGRYVILPDHLHLFCSPKSPQSLGIKEWIKFWKTHTSNQWPRPDEHPIWQLDGWDTQLRTGDNYDQRWNYVRNNPVRHGLVENADDWPYQGEIEPLKWHDK
ncbi:MAG: putative transposase [Verrucomicrobiales bacterium]|jgi:putative transposase